MNHAAGFKRAYKNGKIEEKGKRKVGYEHILIPTEIDGRMLDKVRLPEHIIKKKDYDHI